MSGNLDTEAGGLPTITSLVARFSKGTNESRYLLCTKITALRWRVRMHTSLSRTAEPVTIDQAITLFQSTRHRSRAIFAKLLQPAPFHGG